MRGWIYPGINGNFQRKFPFHFSMEISNFTMTTGNRPLDQQKVCTLGEMNLKHPKPLGFLLSQRSCFDFPLAAAATTSFILMASTSRGDACRHSCFSVDALLYQTQHFSCDSPWNTCNISVQVPFLSLVTFSGFSLIFSTIQMVVIDPTVPPFPPVCSSLIAFVPKLQMKPNN